MSNNNTTYKINLYKIQSGEAIFIVTRFLTFVPVIDMVLKLNQEQDMLKVKLISYDFDRYEFDVFADVC